MKPLFELLDHFHPVKSTTREYLSSLLRCKRFKKDEIILTKGQICRYIFFIESGAVRIYHLNKQGEEITTWIHIERGIFIVPASFFGQEPSLDYIIALEDCVVHGITYDQLNDICRKDLEFWWTRGLITEYYYKLSETARRKLLEMGNEERYLKLLETNPEWFGRIGLSYIASYLGMSLPTLARIRARVSKSSGRKKK